MSRLDLHGVTTLSFTPPPHAPYPEDVCDAVRQAALLEIKWRLQDFQGRPMDHHGWLQRQMEVQAELTLARYRDILYTYWWSVHIDQITRDIVVSIISDEDYAKEPDLTFKARYQRIGLL